MSQKLEPLGSVGGTGPCAWVSAEPGERLISWCVISGVSSPGAASWMQHHSHHPQAWPPRQFLTQARKGVPFPKVQLSICQPWAGDQPHREKVEISQVLQAWTVWETVTKHTNYQAQLPEKIRWQATPFFTGLNKFTPFTILKWFWIRTRKESSEHFQFGFVYLLFSVQVINTNDLGVGYPWRD